MDLIDQFRQLSARAAKQLQGISTEEATKTALVMPFIQMLGYNVFDLSEVVPEYTADVGTKKGEKVDYAIMRDGSPIMIFECKSAGTDLGHVHVSQLFRYFSTLDTRFAIMTNGIDYHFYSDLDKPNKMDDKPFLVFNILEQNDETRLAQLIDELKKFTKSAFDLDNILSTANELKYKREIKNLILAEYNNPSEELVRLFAGQVYSGLKRKAVIEDFTDITKKAFREFVTDRITSRLDFAKELETNEVQQVENPETKNEGDAEEDELVTTQEELDGYYIVKAILREVVDAKRVHIRDVQSYCGVILDNNNRKPICRLRFNRHQKYLGLFDSEKNEEQVPISDLDEIYNYADRLRATIAFYDDGDS